MTFSSAGVGVRLAPGFVARAGRGSAASLVPALRAIGAAALLLVPARRGAFSETRFGIGSFCLALVIWRGSAGRQGHPGRKVYSFQGRPVSTMRHSGDICRQTPAILRALCEPF